jgi:hypothetical protein
MSIGEPALAEQNCSPLFLERVWLQSEGFRCEEFASGDPPFANTVALQNPKSNLLQKAGRPGGAGWELRLSKKTINYVSIFLLK